MGAIARAANVGVKRIPIGAAKSFERVAGSWRRRVSRQQYDAPMRGAELLSIRRGRIVISVGCRHNKDRGTATTPASLGSQTDAVKTLRFAVGGIARHHCESPFQDLFRGG